MKTTLRSLSGITFLGVMLFASNIVVAQTTADSTSTTTTTTSAGTISQFSPDTIVVKTTTSSEPVSYASTKTTTYVDESGNPVSVETVKSGLPVTVYYANVGGRMVATRVVVRKTVTSETAAPSVKETSTTTSAGTISQFSPDGIVVQTTTSAAPVSYTATKTTTYVDENGNPVSVETVKSGLPVTVYYAQDGDKMVATKVVVRKTTTTTTTPSP